MQVKEEKILLRKKYKQTRNNIECRTEKSNSILHNLISCEIYKKATQILFYYPIHSEVNTIPLIKKSLDDGKKIALPTCLNKCGDMSFYYIKTLENLQKNSFGIMEPVIDSNNEVFDFTKTVVIVPAITFDKHGFRLGYGGGYYDKFLQNIKNSTSISVGLCYNEVLCENLPHETHDINVDYVITEQSVFSC